MSISTTDPLAKVTCTPSENVKQTSLQTNRVNICSELHVYTVAPCMVVKSRTRYMSSYPVVTEITFRGVPSSPMSWSPTHIDCTITREPSYRITGVFLPKHLPRPHGTSRIAPPPTVVPWACTWSTYTCIILS